MASGRHDVDPLLRPPGRLPSPDDGRHLGPTSRRELLGWYMYAFAAETYVVCGIGSFIPILLETLARQNGFLLSDPSRACGSSDSRGSDDGQCAVYVLGIEINTASFAMYTFAVSVLVQALVVVSISGAADHGNYRKKLLLAFAWTGSFAVMAFIFIGRESYLIGALLTVVSNTAFGASFVLLNSFLPLLVRNHPSLLQTRPPTDSSGLAAWPDEPAPAYDDGRSHGDGALPGPGATEDELTCAELQMSSRLSSQGMGVGYCAALFVQCVAIGVLIAMRNTTWSQRIVLFIVGAWWSVFTIPAALWLRPRPGPPLVKDGQPWASPWLSYLTHAWKSLFRTVQQARRLVDIALFLAGWFLLSDAIATTSSTAILFAKTQLHMQPWALGMINVMVTTMAVLGAFGWPWMSRLLGIQAQQTILVCIGLFELIPLYGLMGYLPFVRKWHVLGLQQPWEMYPLAAVYGLVMGGLSSYCRSLFGELIPPGSEAAFYALYAITDKGSSVFGPTIVGAIIDRTGDIRPAFCFLAALVGLSAPLIWLVDVARGKREAEGLSGTVGFLGRSRRGPGEEEEEEEEEEEDGERERMLTDSGGYHHGPTASPRRL